MTTVQTFRLLLMMEITGLEIRERERRPRGQDLIFSHILTKIPIVLFLPEELALLFLLKEVTPSPDQKMIKLLTFDTCFCY